MLPYYHLVDQVVDVALNLVEQILKLLEQIRLELTFFLTVLIWRLNYHYGPDIVISEVLRSVANRFEPTYSTCSIMVN